MNYATLKEWIWCLASPAHARTTSLRISEHHEEIALKALAGLVAVIFLACAFVAGIDWNKYQNLRQLRKEHNQVQVIDQSNVRFL